MNFAFDTYARDSADSLLTRVKSSRDAKSPPLTKLGLASTHQGALDFSGIFAWDEVDCSLVEESQVSPSFPAHVDDADDAAFAGLPSISDAPKGLVGWGGRLPRQLLVWALGQALAEVAASVEKAGIPIDDDCDLLLLDEEGEPQPAASDAEIGALLRLLPESTRGPLVGLCFADNANVQAIVAFAKLDAPSEPTHPKVDLPQSPEDRQALCQELFNDGQYESLERVAMQLLHGGYLLGADVAQTIITLLGKAQLHLGQRQAALASFDDLRTRLYPKGQPRLQALADELADYPEVADLFKAPSLADEELSTAKRWWASLPDHGSGWQPLIRELVEFEGEPSEEQLAIAVALPKLKLKRRGREPWFTSLEPIRTLRGLRELWVAKKQGMQDWSALSSAVGLRFLHVAEPDFDLALLANLEKLERLTLRGQQYEDLGALPPLPHLYKLSVDAPLRNIEGIESYPRLRSVAVSGTEGALDLAPMAALRQLEHFECDGPASLAPLAACTALERLVVHHSTAPLQGLPVLADLPQLKKVSAGGVGKADIRAFTKKRPDVELDVE